MIPVQLTIEGLYSYQEKQSIDFSTLTSDKLFGIFGTVGSGKSSILEAITFALYGKTDRLLLSGDNRNYNMMNLKSDQLYIEFDFMAGGDDTVFKSVVTAKRNSKRHEDVKKIERIVYKNVHDELIPITSEELEETIGLSYDNFKRTIIIPQGKFQDFLQLGNTERTRMMKDLFNLEKFELSPRLRGIESENLGSLQITEGELKQLEEISEEQVSVKKEELAQTNNKLSLVSKDIGVFEKQLSALEKLSELYGKLSIKEKTLTDLNKKKSHFDALQIKIENYDYCNTHFKNKIETSLLHETRINKLQQQIDKDTKQNSLLKDKELAASEALQLSTEKYKNLNKYNKEVEQLQKIIEIQSYTSKITTSKERLINGKNAVEKATEGITNLNGEIGTLTKRTQKLKANLPNYSELNKASEWHSRNKQFNNEQALLLSEQKNIQKESETISKQVEEAKLQQNLRFKSEDWVQWHLELDVLKLSKASELKVLKEQQNNTLVQQKLVDYSKHLHEGEGCPLCGALEHPKPIEEGNINAELQSVKVAIVKFEEELGLLENFEKALLKWGTEWKSLQKQSIAQSEKLIVLKANIEQHQSKQVLTYRSAESVIDAQKKLELSQQAIEKNEKLLSKYNEQISKQNKDKERYIGELHKIETEVGRHLQSVTLLEQQVNTELLNKNRKLDESTLEHKCNTLLQDIASIETKFKEDTQKLELIKLGLQNIKGSIDANQKSLLQEQSLFKDINSSLNTILEDSKFETLNQVKTILKEGVSIEANKQELTNYLKALDLIQNEIKQLLIEVDNRKYDADNHAEIRLQTIRLHQQQKELLGLRGNLENQLKQISSSLIEKLKLSEKYTALKARNENINTLKRLFKSSGFVNYVSSVYLQNICAAANERFYKMTRHKLSLKLNKENNFEVRDHLNGGKIRSVKTLSGGQTFQAALALALALSDNIQSRNQSNQNFFFLDEGFGSLDKASLEMVFSTLKNLRQENRIVGVISHVEELQQEIPTYLEVNQTENDGSFIKCSWEG